MLTKGHADVLQILTVVIKVSYFPVRSCRCVTNINCFKLQNKDTFIVLGNFFFLTLTFVLFFQNEVFEGF